MKLRWTRVLLCRNRFELYSRSHWSGRHVSKSAEPADGALLWYGPDGGIIDADDDADDAGRPRSAVTGI